MTEERLLEILENFEKGNTDEGVEDCEIEYCKNRHWLVWMGEINDGQKTSISYPMRDWRNFDGGDDRTESEP